jgi:glycosyltransferase involved in cell wall biosynthesis
VTGPSLDVVVVEPWRAGSHAAWVDGVVAASRHRVRVVDHPAGPWRWRLRGAALTLADQLAADVARHGPPDALVVSGGLVDVAALLGAARRAVGAAAVVVYLHETQLVVPPGPHDRPDAGLALVGWTSAAVADRVVFNSRFHHDAFWAALAELLDRLAHDRPHQHLVPDVRRRSTVVPVGIEAHRLVDAPRLDDGGPPLVVWNHRWDHDKDPGALFDALVRLAAEGVAFRLAVTGENRRPDPREVRAGLARLGGRVVHVGHLPRPDYEALLRRADVVVSTARHELFGVAVAEAVAAGAVPVLPRRQAYPDLIPARWHDAVLHDDVPTHQPGGLVDALRRALVDLPAARAAVAGLRDAMRRYDHSEVVPRLDDVVAGAVGATPPRHHGATGHGIRSRGRDGVAAC